MSSKLRTTVTDMAAEQQDMPKGRVPTTVKVASLGALVGGLMVAAAVAAFGPSEPEKVLDADYLNLVAKAARVDYAEKANEETRLYMNNFCKEVFHDESFYKFHGVKVVWDDYKHMLMIKCRAAADGRDFYGNSKFRKLHRDKMLRIQKIRTKEYIQSMRKKSGKRK